MNNNIKFDYYINKFLEMSYIKNKRSTYTTYKYLTIKWIAPFFKNHSLFSINSDLLLKFIEILMKNNLSVKYIRDLLSILKQILKLAHKRIIVPMPRNLKKETEIISDRELCVLENYLKSNVTLINLGIYLSLYTGIRIGELCAIQWKNIDLVNKKLIINQAQKRVFENRISENTHIIIDSPKSISSIREIPLPIFLCNYLNKYKAKDEVFLLTGTTKYMDSRLLSLKFKQILKNANISNYTFHSLRHTFATRCIKLGCDAKTLSLILRSFKCKNNT